MQFLRNSVSKSAQLRGALITFFIAPIFNLGAATAQDLTLIGGDLSSTLTDHNAIQVTAPNVTNEDKRQRQISGFSIFHHEVTRQEGLGPRFVNLGCGSCHVQNGRGRVRITPRATHKNSMVIKVALKGLSESGSPRDVPRVGEQLQERTTSRKSLYKTRLRFRIIKGRYPDGTKYKLRKPVLRFRIGRIARSKVVSSLRMTPALIGSGLLEAIPEATVLELSDPDDENDDGISGVPNYVIDKITGDYVLGRFGFRGSNPTLEQQTAAAAFNDMGVTTYILNPGGGSPELSDDALSRLTIYQALAGVPIARNQDDSDVIAGKQLFQSIGCNGCHVMSIMTQHPVHEELSVQLIHPFTDLLLHDMGPGLADKRPEFSASGSEWRTTPLWGIGFQVSNLTPHFLHDGRARTIEEAILWHGGEAENSKIEFMNLDKQNRAKLIKFIGSL